MANPTISLINYAGTALAAVWLTYIYVRKRHMFVKPSMLVLVYTHVLFQWPLALSGATLSSKLPDPLALTVLIQGYMLVGLALISRTWTDDAQAVWRRLPVSPASASRVTGIMSILIGMAVVLMSLSLVVGSHTAGFHDHANYISRYSFSLMTSALAPLLVGLSAMQALNAARSLRVVWSVVTVGLIAALGASILASGDRSPIAYLAIVLLATFLWHRQLKPGPRAWIGAAFALLLASALMIALRHGDQNPAGLLALSWINLPELLLRTFAIPFEVGTWYVHYAQSIGPIGVAAFPKLASALGVTAVDVPNLIGSTYSDSIGVGHRGILSGLNPSAGHLLSYYGYMGIAALPVCLGGLMLVDTAVKIYARLDETILVPCVATVSCQTLLFLQSDYTVTWVTHGLGFTLVLCFVLGRRLPAGSSGARALTANPRSSASNRALAITTPRIAHVSTVHPAFDVRIFHKECRSLALAGFDVQLIVRHARKARVDGVSILPLPEPANRLARMLFMGLRAFRAGMACRAQIIHLHDPELVPIGLLLKLAGRTVIYDAHEDLPRQIMSKHWIRPRVRRAISGASELVEDFCARRFDAVVAATPVIGARFSRLNPNTVVVNNYPLESEMPPLPAWSERERAVCYVGGIAPERGIGEIVKAIEGLDAVLHLAGPVSPPEYLDTLKKLPGWRKVRFHGFVDREKVYRLLCRSRVGLVCLRAEPNHIDSQPIKLYEYWSAGIPVVASDFPRWKALIEAHDAGICVDPSRVDEIARAIRQLLDCDDSAGRMGNKGREMVRSTLNWRHEERRLIELYRRLTAARRN